VDHWFRLGVVLLVVIVDIALGAYLRRRISAGGKTDDKDSTGDSASTLAVAAAFAIILVLFCVSPLLDQAGLGTLPGSWVMFAVGLCMMAAGVSVRSVSMRTLGRFYTRRVESDSGHELVRVGIYGVIRNPGYLGTILVLVGGALALGNWLTIAATVVVVIVAYSYRIHVEEALLQRVFGQEWSEYRAHTKRLIPFVL
jgi:protein-S-isoprenylcysteine O-methyltransferase Ste14